MQTCFDTKDWQVSEKEKAIDRAITISGVTLDGTAHAACDLKSAPIEKGSDQTRLEQSVKDSVNSGDGQKEFKF